MSSHRTAEAARTIDLPAPSMDAEVELMLRVQREEPGAFTELVETYWPKIFGRFYRLLANRQDAEDLAQEVFLRLYRARKRYQPRARFNTWLFHIAQNVARNALRSRRRRPTVGLQSLSAQEELLQFPDLWSNEADSPSHSLEQRELAGMIRAAVSDLGERQRTALELFQFHQHSYAEIAAHLDMTPEAAKSLLYRARLQLRNHLARVLEVG